MAADNTRLITATKDFFNIGHRGKELLLQRNGKLDLKYKKWQYYVKALAL